MKIVLVVVLLMFACVVRAQETELDDTLYNKVIQLDSVLVKAPRMSFRKIIVPATLVTAGIFSVGNGFIRHEDMRMRNELQEHIHQKFTVDNFTQYAPAAAVFSLKALGVKSSHTWKEQALVTGMSFLLMAALVNGMKYTLREQRPDGTTRNSFPSGHTATAFVGAEILYQEYKDESPWIGYAGYAVATGTGFLRMYNNRHWLTDVVGGAGVGILSARLAIGCTRKYSLHVCQWERSVALCWRPPLIMIPAVWDFAWI
jgi:hypothetical protein